LIIQDLLGGRPFDSMSTEFNQSIHLGFEITFLGMEIQVNARKLLGWAFTGIHRDRRSGHSRRGSITIQSSLSHRGGRRT
jgi:hypothetical protein